MTAEKPKIVVAGNATLDVFIRETTSIDHDRIVISSEDGKVVELQVEQPPILPGGKYRVNQDLAKAVRQLWHRYAPGGGGYNSVLAIRNLPDIESDIDLVYIDVSTPDDLIIQELRHHNISPHFFFRRDVPYNLVIGWRDDKIILKGPQLGRVKPTKTSIEDAEKIIHDSDATLINSIKDPKYFDEYLKISEKHKVPVYVVVTTSLDNQYVFEHVLPHVIAILNYDELPAIIEASGELDEKSRLELALEILVKIRKDGTNADKPIFVTLGRNGAYCAKKGSIIHIKLNPEYTERVSHGISLTLGSTRGAGDVFAAAVVTYDTLAKRKSSLTDLLYKANGAAIRHIGYSGHLPKEAFEYREFPIRKS